MKPRTCIIYKHIGRHWGVADITIIGPHGRDTTIVNFQYEVTPEWIYTYDAIGGSGTGYKRGALIGKIYIGDCELVTYECNEMADGSITKTLKS